MLTIITGSRAAGLSRLLCCEMIEASVKEPDASYIAIVPEQATLRMQRMAVEAHPAHAVMNIDIVSFERLARKVFEELGCQESDLLNDTGKILILRKVLEESRQDLILYRNKVHMPGFAGEMKSQITELKQYGINDNELFLMQESAEHAGDRILYSKLQDIRLICRRFSESIKDRYTIQEELLDVFAGLVSQSGLIRDARIYLDGFTGFTPVQYRLLRELLRYGAQLTVTVTIPQDRIRPDAENSGMFKLSCQTMNKLQEIAEEIGSPIRLRNVPDDKILPEGYVFGGADIRKEVLFIADRILAGVRSGNRRFRDYAVILSDMEAYHNVIRDTFRKAGIPCFIDYKTELGNNALARFTIAALRTVAENFSFDSVFAFLKSDLTDLSRDEVGLLENYCLEFGIRGRQGWSREFARNRLLRKDPEKEEASLYYWDLEQVNACRRKALAPLLELSRRLGGGAKMAQEYAEGLKQLFLSCDAEGHMADKSRRFYEQEDMSHGKEYEQIFSLITSLLDQIAALMGSEAVTVSEYLEILTGALDEIRVSIIPPALDAVMIGDLTRTRLGEVKVLFLAGANDGRMPAPTAHAGLLTGKEREFLKQEHFELAPTVLEHLFTQHFYLYLMMRIPSEELIFTYALSQDGEEMLPSCLIEGIEDILPGFHLKEAEGASCELWKERAAYELAETAAAPEQINEWQGRILRYFALHDRHVLDQILAGSFYTNQALPLDEQTALDLYGGVLKGSVSRYETFYECPFRHFMNYGLRIEERPEFEVQASDVGTLYHESLERYSRKLGERGLSFRDVSDEVSDQIAAEAVSEAAASLEKDVLTDSSRNTYLLDRIARVTKKTADVLRLHVKQGLYEPAFFELAFSDEAMQSAMFRGKIDRVDIYDGADVFVKVIDYKSGNKKFSIRDIYTGQQLQLTAYLSEAVQKAREMYPGRNVKPGGVYYYLIQDRFVRDDKEEQMKYRMSGITNCDPEALKAIDMELTLQSASTIAEIKYGKNGLDYTSKVANDTEFSHLITFVQNRIEDAGTRISKGEVGVCPSYESPEKNACTYCEYKEVCKFESGRWGSDYHKLPEETGVKEMEKEIYGR